MNSSLKFACLLAAFAICLYKSEAFVVPKNETDGGPCRNFTIANILNLTEELRIRMHLPIPRFNFPPLHPLFVELISLNNFELLAGVEIDMHNISFFGFRDFEIRNLDFNLIGFGLSLQFFIPALTISGQHVSNGSLYGLVPVVGSGPMNLTVHNLTFDIAGQLNHTNNTWNAVDLNVNFTITNITGGFENLSDPFFNDLLYLSGAEILELAWPSLQPTVEEEIGWAVGEFLNDFELEELMGMLFGAGIDWSEVDDQTTLAPPLTAVPPAMPQH